MFMNSRTQSEWQGKEERKMSSKCQKGFQGKAELKSFSDMRYVPVHFEP